MHLELLYKYHEGDRAVIEELICLHLDGLVEYLTRFGDTGEATTFLRRYLGLLPPPLRAEKINASADHEVRKAFQKFAKNLRDRFWVNDFCRGRDEVVAMLVDRYSQRLHATAYNIVGCPHLANDMVQDVMVKLLEMPREERRKRFREEGHNCIQPYFITMVRRRAIDWYRREKIMVQSNEFSKLTIEPSDRSPLTGLTHAGEDALQLVRMAVRLMTPMEQQVFELWLKGVPNETIDNELDKKSSAHRIKERIARHFERYQAAREDVYLWLVLSNRYQGFIDPHQTLLEGAQTLLNASELRYFSQFKEEHLAEKTTPFLTLDEMNDVIKTKRGIKRKLINGKQ